MSLELNLTLVSAAQNTQKKLCNCSCGGKLATFHAVRNTNLIINTHEPLTCPLLNVFFLSLRVAIVTSAKEVVFSPMCICWFVGRIAQTLAAEIYPWNLDEGWGLGPERTPPTFGADPDIENILFTFFSLGLFFNTQDYLSRNNALIPIPGGWYQRASAKVFTPVSAILFLLVINLLSLFCEKCSSLSPKAEPFFFEIESAITREKWKELNLIFERLDLDLCLSLCLKNNIFITRYCE